MTLSKNFPTKFASAAVAILLGGLSLLGTSLLTADAAQADTISDEAQFVRRINEARVAGGLKELTVNIALVDAGRGWATKMRDTSVAANVDDCLISHNPNLRNAVNARWRKLGENVGCGDTDVDTLHEAFMNSPKHKENIMDPTFDSIGIGIVMAGDTMFVTEQFMQTDNRTVTTAPNSTTPNALALKGPNVGGVSQVASPAPKQLSAKIAPKKPKTKRAAKTATKKAPTAQGIPSGAKIPVGRVSF